MTSEWHWKPFYVRLAYTLEDIIDFFLFKLPRNKVIKFIQSWFGTLALSLDREAIKSLKQAMEDAKHGRFLTHEEVFGKRREETNEHSR